MQINAEVERAAALELHRKIASLARQTNQAPQKILKYALRALAASAAKATPISRKARRFRQLPKGAKARGNMKPPADFNADYRVFFDQTRERLGVADVKATGLDRARRIVFRGLARTTWRAGDGSSKAADPRMGRKASSLMSVTKERDGFVLWNRVKYVATIAPNSPLIAIQKATSGIQKRVDREIELAMAKAGF